MGVETLESPGFVALRTRFCMQINSAGPATVSFSGVSDLLREGVSYNCFIHTRAQC